MPTIYEGAPIGLHNETGSALDFESERLAQAALETIVKSRAGLVTARRLSIIERFVVLTAGRIADQEMHVDLLAQRVL